MPNYTELLKRYNAAHAKLNRLNERICRLHSETVFGRNDYVNVDVHYSFKKEELLLTLLRQFTSQRKVVASLYAQLNAENDAQLYVIYGRA